MSNTIGSGWLNPITGADWKKHLDRLIDMFRGTPDVAKQGHAVATSRFFVYPNARELWKRTTTSGECVKLIQDHIPEVGLAADWIPGPRVEDLDSGSLPEGAVVATFWDQEYPNAKTGNHAAFYISHDDEGILVAEQSHSTSPHEFRYKKRGGGTGKILWRGIDLPEDQSGDAPSMTNSAEYYYVVLKRRSHGGTNTSFE